MLIINYYCVIDITSIKRTPKQGPEGVRLIQVSLYIQYIY